MWIDIKPLKANTKPSNRDTFVSALNVIDDSDLHWEKQYLQITP
jgi:hypothetical protein